MLRRTITRHSCILLTWSAWLWIIVEALRILDANFNLSTVMEQAVLQLNGRTAITDWIATAVFDVWTFVRTHSTWWVSTVLIIVIRQEAYRWLRVHRGRRDADRLLTIGVTFLGTLYLIDLLSPHVTIKLPRTTVEAIVTLTIVHLGSWISRLLHRPSQRVLVRRWTRRLSHVAQAILGHNQGHQHRPGGHDVAAPRSRNHRRMGS